MKSQANIQWFPGHMTKTRREFQKTLPTVDIVIELRDARIPEASKNPLIDSLLKDKPRIICLTRKDLADPEETKKWLDHYGSKNNVVALNALQAKDAKKLLSLSKRIVKTPDRAFFEHKIMIVGIPNIGKSTLINTLMGKKRTKVQNKPGVTKQTSWIPLETGIVLLDTPGILWPKFEDQKSAKLLAATGAIKDTHFEEDDIALFVIEFLMKNYPDKLKERYKLKQLPSSAIDCIYEIGKRRGCLVKGGEVDEYKVYDILLNEFKNGIIGNFTLETV
ncbi:ribosome biogenesis GTPase YlqF [Candidatus Marinamargulisbacteria bacterium SCGC AAA071-K20]|nr:ribosome biogenesis GTPase YlqF [Candidatus Marinamargulisbacteria bacterium SCGC AAA071-K20]